MILLAEVLYHVLLVRTKPEKWGRECSLDDEEQKRMYAIGEDWAEKNKECRSDVSVVSDNLRLTGEYYDFGADKAVIIIAGRLEACRYCCFFAEPYQKAGYNVLVIDNRAHGFSEGKYDCLGYREYADILAWAKFLNEEKHDKNILCHGICIGSATALYAMARPDCPEYFQGLVADGMFTTFRESFNNHLIEQHRPKFPTTLLVMLLISIHSHANAFSDGPVTRMKDMHKPILFLYSLQDAYSVPEKGRELFELCTAPKQLVWFEKGVHSHLRINAPEKYDQAILDFIKEHFS